MAFALFHVPHKISYLMHVHSLSFISNKEEINNISNVGVGLRGWGGFKIPDFSRLQLYFYVGAFTSRWGAPPQRRRPV